MFTVVLKRSAKPDVVLTDVDDQTARRRVEHLLLLHSLMWNDVTYDSRKKTYTINATDYYTR